MSAELRFFAEVAREVDGSAILTLSAENGTIAISLPKADPKVPIRFSVGQPGFRSSVWRLWANKRKSDVYLSTRASAGVFKVSLHETGDWRVQWVSEDHGDVTYRSLKGSQPTSRILFQWTRPLSNASGWTEALSVWVPLTEVSVIPGDPEPPADSQWVAPPPVGFAIEFRIMFVKPGGGRFNLVAAVDHSGRSLAFVNGFELGDGDVVLLFAATDRVSPATLKQLDQLRENERSNLAQTFDTRAETGPRTAIYARSGDGHVSIWDLSLSAPYTGTSHSD